ncbi:hypothetical protein MKW92_034625, partial [Papaver armeniacum]
MANHEACLACSFLDRPCSEECHYIPQLRSYCSMSRFQIAYGAAAKPTDIQDIENRITQSTKIFEQRARTHEPVFGATGILLALDLRVRDEVSRLYAIVGRSRYISTTDGVMCVTRPPFVEHFFLADTENFEQLHRACPVCVYLPRKCEANCPFKRFFEEQGSVDFEDFYTLLWDTTSALPDRPNLESADECDKFQIMSRALEFENNARVQDPLYGTTRVILDLYKYWWSLNQYVNSVEEREQQHQSVQNLPTAEFGSRDKGRQIMIPEFTTVACVEGTSQQPPQGRNSAFCSQQGESSSKSTLSSIPPR